MVVPLRGVHQCRLGFYAINNEFLVEGPKDFIHLKVSDGGDMYFRIDLPGVPEDGVRVKIDQTKKAMSIIADAPKVGEYDSPRRYEAATSLFCSCCEISSFTSLMSNGVLSLVLYTTPDPKLGNCCTVCPPSFEWSRDEYDSTLTGRALERHPCVTQGSDVAYEAKLLQNGSLFVRVDMPGVPKDKFRVDVKNGRVSVFGDGGDCGRRYSGDVAKFEGLKPSIKYTAMDGVIRLTIWTSLGL